MLNGIIFELIDLPSKLDINSELMFRIHSVELLLSFYAKWNYF
jgi:hypothetical protein